MIPRQNLVANYKPLVRQVASRKPVLRSVRLSPNIASGTITTPFGGSTRSERFHPGIDIANKRGSPVGTGVPVTITKINRGSNSPYGNFVEGVDAMGSTHRWSHLANQYVRIGQYVPLGGKIGAMGNTGNVYSQHGGDGTHLDYRIRSMFNKYVNPMQYPIK